MTETKHHTPHDKTPADATDGTADQASHSAPQERTDSTLDGQLGPDEISEPEEVVRNNEAKQHQ